jgi:hypothetical protein
MTIAAYVLTKRPNMYENIVGNLARQTRRPDLVVVVVSNCSGYPPTLKEIGVKKSYYIHPPDHLNYSQLNNMAIESISGEVAGGGLACKMDDDDWYGPGYFAGIEEAFLGRNEISILGKYDVSVRWLYGNFKNSLKLATPRPPYPRNAPTVTGPTICVNLDHWREWPGFRYDQDCSSNQADFRFFDSLKKYNGIINTIGPEDFFYQRYPDDHCHGWREPDPEE